MSISKQNILTAIDNGTLTEADFNDITNSMTAKKLKVNLITINQGGDVIKYSNTSTNPNTDIFDGTQGLPTNHKRRFANNLTIRCKSTDENVIMSYFVPIIQMLVGWGYVITNRQRNIDQTDASKITNVFDLEQRPLT